MVFVAMAMGCAQLLSWSVVQAGGDRVRIPIEAGGEGGKRGVLRLRGGCASLAAAPLRMTILLWAAALGMTILFWCSMASATSYYVSNGGTDGPSCTTAATACKTLAYVSSSITLNAGDSVLLQRGGIWNEQLVATASGTSGSPIVYDAYGTGPAPVITAAAPILPWTSGTGTPWIYVSGNTWKASMATTITPPTVNLVQFGALYGRKQPYGSGCASSIVSKYDWCLSWPWLYVWSGNSSANPVSTYATDVSVVPIVAQSAGLAMISIVGRNWLTFQHIKVQNFDYIGVSVTGGSDHLVFANMEVDGMVPYGTTPLGFYVNATNPTNIQFLNDDAHLNYDGFRFDGTATAITVTNCRGYANRDAGLSDNTGKATYSYSHFYGNNVAQFLASDVSGGIAGSGNIGLVCGTAAGFLSAPGMCSSTAGPVAVNFSPYPARFSFTVDDVGSQPNTEAYIDTFLGTGPFGSRGLHFNAAVVPSYPVIWSDVNSWYAAGNEIDSHSWSHQYYTTNRNPCGISPCSPPYPNAPSHRHSVHGKRDCGDADHLREPVVAVDHGDRSPGRQHPQHQSVGPALQHGIGTAGVSGGASSLHCRDRHHRAIRSAEHAHYQPAQRFESEHQDGSVRAALRPDETGAGGDVVVEELDPVQRCGIDRIVLCVSRTGLKIRRLRRMRWRRATRRLVEVWR